MTFDELQLEYRRRYDNEAYAGDEQTENLLGLLNAASALSVEAKAEFVRAFEFESALDGELYLGGKASARINFPRLLAECPAAGINLVTR